MLHSSDVKTMDKSTAQKIADEVVSKYTNKDLYPALAKLMGYEFVPPTIDEFVDSDEYLGRILYDEMKQESRIWPVWRQALRQIYPNPFYSPYVEVICTGAIGTGKSTLCKIGTMYDLAKLCMLTNPQEKYGLLPTTEIEYAVISTTISSSEDVFYSELLEWMQTSPVFRKWLSSSNGRTLLPKNIDLTSGSRPKHVLGRAIFGAILSELNFQTRINDQAYENYTNAKRRMQSRFSKRGKLPGHLWLDSSHRDENDFLDAYIPTVRGDSTVAIYDHSIWEVKPWAFDMSETFKVFIGDESKDPFIVEDALHGDIDSNRVIEVPLSLKEDFQKDIYNALRDLAGISTVSLRKFIPSIEHLSRSLVMVNWFDKEIVKLDLVNKSERLISYINPLRITERLNPNQPRMIHADLAINGDRAGIAIGHLAGYVTVRTKDYRLNIDVVSKQPWIIMDCVIALEAKAGQEIPLYKIRDFVLDLAEQGLPIGVVSTDGWQSVFLRQELQSLGFSCDLLSVDRTMDAYINLKQALYQDRILIPRHSLLFDELKGLIRVGNKVDHPSDGSKDVADAVAGVVQSIVNNQARYAFSFAIQESQMRTMSEYVL